MYRELSMTLTADDRLEIHEVISPLASHRWP